VELRESEERYRTLFEKTANPILIIDTEGNYIDCNEAALQFVECTRDELLARNIRDFIPPSKERQVLEEHRPLWDGGGTVETEYYVRGKVKILELTITPAILQGKRVVFGVGKDITERKKAGEEIRKVQERFSGIYNSSKDAIGYASLDGVLLDVNDSFCKLTGYSRKELLTRKKYQDITPKEYHEYEAKIIERILRTGKPAEYEKEYIRKDGFRVPILLTTFVVKGDDDKPIGLAAIIKDITERKRAEEALRRSEEQARHLLEFQNKVIDTAVAWIDLLDAEGNVTLWNRAAELISGYSREEVIRHKKIWEWLYPDPEYRAKIFAEAKKIIEKGERVENFETTIRCKDGTLKTISWYSNNILDEKGKPVGSIAVGTDITEIKKAQEKVRESEERFRALSEKYELILETAVEGIGAVDPDENITFVSRALADMLGYKESELVGMNLRELVPAESFDELLKGTERRKRGESDKYEIVMYRKDGEPRTILLSCAPLWNADKTYAGGLGVFTDITERKKAEERIRESEERYRVLVESAADAIFTLNEAGNFLSANQEAAMSMGKTPEDMIGKNMHDLFPKGIADLQMERIKAVFQTGNPVFADEAPTQTKFGQRWYNTTVMPVRDINGKIIYVMAIARDITERKRLEEKLRQYSEHLEELVQKRTEELLESEKRYSVLVEEASDGVAILQDGKIVFANKKGPEMIGYSRDELIGLPFEKLVDEKYRQLVKERYIKRLRGETVPVTYEIELMTKNSERVPVELSATRIHYQGHPADLIIVRDISERKRMEEQRLKLGKLATIGELAAMVGHDLRNPLQAITNASYVINELVKKTDFAGDNFSFVPPHLRKEMLEEYTQLIKMMGIIDESTNYANKIVSDLRDFARTKEPELTEVDLESLIQETLSHISVPENVRVSIRHDQALSKLYVDPTQMRRVFTNLTTNAIQAMPNGGELTISTSLKNGFASIAFQDTGVGIPKEDIEKLFAPLFTRKSKGLGLGLPICKNIIEAHGGRIEVESQEGKGSTFTVKLPVKKGGETSGEEGKHPNRG